MTRDQIIINFTYHKPSDLQQETMAMLRNHMLNLALVIDNSVPISAGRTLALRHLEQCSMYVNAAICRHNATPMETTKETTNDNPQP